jgi:vancomycin resistance protein YoaR
VSDSNDTQSPPDAEPEVVERRPSSAGAAERRAARAARTGTPGDGLRGWWSRLSTSGRIALAVPTGLLAVVVVVGAGAEAFAVGRIYPGVKVAGVGVGGLTPQAATLKLEKELAPRISGRPVTVVASGASWEVSSEKIGAAVDATDTVVRALAITRTDFAASVVARVRALGGTLDLTATVKADPEKLATLIDEIDDSVATPPKDANILVESLEPTLVPAVFGSGVARAVFGPRLLATFAADDREIALDMEAVPPHVSDDDARQALADARKMLGGAAVVAWEQKSWAFEPKTIAGWMTFRSVPFASAAASGSAVASAGGSPESTDAGALERMVLRAGLDSVEVSASVTPLTGGVGRPAINAKFVVEGGRVTVSGGQVGLGPDIAGLTSDLEKALVDGPERKATLRLATLQPELTAEKAKEMGIIERISTYTTTFIASQKSRVNNIHLLADALNDKLVPPGGTFDFNQTVGQRTAAKGYQEAPAIVNGRLVPQIGGGICQIGTTFFNTVFFSGFPVIERKNHSFYISHYPKGRDCTVTWGGPNLRWKNDSPYWVLVKTSYTKSSVTVSLYGTDPGYDVDYTTSAFSNIRPHSIEEIPDPTLPGPTATKLAARVLEEGGVDGALCTVVRTVTKAGVVVRTDTFVSNYKPKVEYVRVGTKSAPATTTPTP